MRLMIGLFIILIFVCGGEIAKAIIVTCDNLTIGRQHLNAASNVMEVCDGTSWIPMDGGTTGSTCTPADKGKQKYASSTIQFCDGTNWHTMKTCATMTSACNQAGRIRWTDSARMIFCDGANWNIMAGSCSATLNCPEYIDSASCTGASCAWTGTKCQPTGCSGYSNSTTCNLDPNCTWTSSYCIDAI